MRTQQAVIAMGGRQEYFVSYSFPFGVRPLTRQHDLECKGAALALGVGKTTIHREWQYHGLDNALYFLNLLEVMSRQKTKAAAA